MTKRNPNLAKLKSSYLFPTIHQRKLDFLAAHPEAKLISLGIGDTTLPIVPHVTEAMHTAADLLGTPEGYSGYGPDQGEPELRKKIARQFYGNTVKPEEIFVSDGAKCDIGRLQLLFGKEARIAIQDPAYPVYGDGSTIQGVSEIHFLACLPENDFFPHFDPSLDIDLIYISSPNNPTGAVATHAQLEELVAYAKERRAIILFDAAYGCFIQDTALPRSIFEIAGARDVAIEINSFSKVSGFTGVRLGWTVVPDTLRFDDGSLVIRDWHRVMTTLFNGASHISQRGGLAVLDPQGLQETREQILHYLENGAILRRALEKKGFEVFGGLHAPYLWVRMKGQKSWDAFQFFLEKLHIVTTPGAGFGPSGEGFLRMTSFGQRPQVLEAAERISNFSFA